MLTLCTSVINTARCVNVVDNSNCETLVDLRTRREWSNTLRLAMGQLEPGVQIR
jgi:hypothetical protein